MLTLEEIVQLLQDRHLPTVAEKTGIKYRTIYNIKNGINTNPSYDTVQKLSGYFGASN
jgi:transcriptional regulator with XRE-family HTH domain